MAKRGYKLQEFVAHSSNVNCLSIGKKACRLLLTGGDDHKVNLWAIGKPVSLMSLCGHTSPVESLAFDSAEVLVVAGAYSGMIKLWDLEEAKMVRSLNGHQLNCNAVAFHPFGEFFASGSMDSNLRIWDIKKKECIHTYKGHTGGISTIRFSPDGRWVVSGGDDNAVKIWDLTAGKLLHDFKFHEGAIRSIDFHPLEFLLATGSADKTVKFWDLETFELIGSSRPEATGVRSITFHPDGRTLFCGLEDSLKVYSWEPLIRHDAVDMGWSTLGDLCIHDGKALGCSYYQNSVGVWVADISIIEPYGAGFVSKQNNEMELKYNMQRSYSAEKITSTMMSSRSMSPDCENKEIKNIYVDSTGGKPIPSQTAQSLSSPVMTSLSQTIQSLSPPGKPVISQTVQSLNSPVKPVVSQPVQSLSSSGKPVVSEIAQSLSSPGHPVASQTVQSQSSPKVVEPANLKDTSDLSSQKKNPASGVQRKRNGNALKKSFVAPSIVPRDSPPGKYTSNHRRESITATKASPDSLIKPVHIQRTSYRNRVDVARLSGIDEAGTLRKSDVDSSVNPNFKSRLISQGDAKESSEQNHHNITGAAENIKKVILPQIPSTQENCDGPVGCSKEIVPVKVVNGVVVVRGRTRSLVEKFERREGIEGNDDDHKTMVSSQVIPVANKTDNNHKAMVPSQVIPIANKTDDDHKTMGPSQVIPVENKTDDDHKTMVPSQVIHVANKTDDDHKTRVPPQLTPTTDKTIIILNAEPQLFIPESASANDEKVAEALVQNHDVFLNTIRSRLTKLQVVRHFWERNDTKGAINALRKLPDHSVHADVVSVLNEKTEILNLDLFSCLLPILVGLLGSTTERHTIVALEMLIKLGGVFGQVIRSTVSARPAVGVNLQAEQRLECCKGCFIHLQKVQKILPVLIRYKYML